MIKSGIGDVLVTSRSFVEYVAMFSITDADLAGTILDCPAGAASFSAVARERGTAVTACDVAYGDMARTVANAGAEAIRGNEYVEANPEQFSGEFFTDANHHLSHRLQASEDFARDVAENPDSYVVAALPDLPFDNRSFDLVLSSHLLFTYGDRFDQGTHLQFLRELLRVARKELRIFPLVSHVTHQRYEHLDALRKVLRADVVETEIVAVDYDFEIDAQEMLVCIR
ncbi:methyltransferase domain-containing protein [Rhodococcus sp. OK302]|uniref:methyltransferase domain-containing protein n=1 Tax=Rhodococcus sp. OK302 TaxID=1882769 RepID=UPI000B93DC95|nr:methyltransferase domain-containing protein [Rhodococcus sp. OK302]OYD69804.1 methyltransferase family protein [Rhodococcus sp. OK302]